MKERRENEAFVLVLFVLLVIIGATVMSGIF